MTFSVMYIVFSILQKTSKVLFIVSYIENRNLHQSFLTQYASYSLELKVV